MPEISLETPKEKAFPLYNPEGKFLGMVDNEMQFQSIRVQICEAKLKGYYFMDGNEKIVIDENGRIAIWKDGFFDTWNNLVIQLL